MVADTKSEAVAHLKRFIAELKLELAGAERALQDLEPGSGRVPQMMRIPKAVPLGLSVTDAVIEAVRKSEGRDRSTVIGEAVDLMSTNSADPRKNAGTRLGQLITEGRLVERDGKVYLGTRA
jgi:hypothetical protein